MIERVIGREPVFARGRGWNSLARHMGLWQHIAAKINPHNASGVRCNSEPAVKARDPVEAIDRLTRWNFGADG
jgi:hypothetical protein